MKKNWNSPEIMEMDIRETAYKAHYDNRDHHSKDCPCHPSNAKKNVIGTPMCTCNTTDSKS